MKDSSEKNGSSLSVPEEYPERENTLGQSSSKDSTEQTSPEVKRSKSDLPAVDPFLMHLGDDDITQTGVVPKSEQNEQSVEGSQTKSFIPREGQSESSEFSKYSASQENEKTIVSQRAVAAPAEFYRSMPLAELAAMLEGKELDHFNVEQMIGGGGMGAVFRGRDLRLDRTVAIKVIPGSKRDYETLRRFRLEAQAAARLDHPNIARVYYVGEAEQWNYIVFEFIDGVNVRDLVSMGGPLPIDDAVYYTRQIAEALEHAFERDVVHRDIKPSNILVTAAGIAKVVDMGLARNVGMEQSSADATASGVTLGTFDYISPEQARNPRDADVRSDLYSLGCSLFFMLTGKPPFPEGTVLQKLLKHGSVPPPDPRAWREDISDQLYLILMKLMGKQPNDRYQKPSELVNDLMLLAEVEELPRSQSPGTMVFAPTVDQKSIVEINLPWLVPFAFLLGSTIWLQSLQALSQGYGLRPLDFAELPTTSRVVDVSNDANSTNAPASPPDQDPSPSEVELPDPPVSIEGLMGTTPTVPQSLVVCGIRPANVADGRWADSLQQAIKMFDASLHSKIEIRGLIEFDQPVVVNKSVTIQGNTQGKRAKLFVNNSALSETELDRGLIQVQGADLTIENLDFAFQVKNANTRNGLFGLREDATLTLRGSLITLDGPSDKVCAIVASEVDLAEEFSGASASEAAFEVSLEKTIIRGNGSVLNLVVDLQFQNRMAMSVEQSLIAVSGHALMVENWSGLFGDERVRNLRIFCDQSTFFTGESFAKLEYAEVSTPLVSLNRTSRGCVFESPPGTAHLTLSGLGQDSVLANLNRFLLKGSDNAYDENLEVLCRCYDPENAEIFTFGFNEASREGWMEERGNEFKVRWEDKREVSLNLTEISPADFAVSDGPFSPGFKVEDTYFSF